MSIPPWLHLFDAISSAVHSAVFIIAVIILWKGMRINAEEITRIHKVLDPILVESQAKKNKIKNKKK